MCDPISLPTLALASAGISAIGQGISAYGAHQQGRYEAKVADINAGLARDRAQDALDRGRVEVRQYQREAGRQQGALRAAMAANGIDPSFGSAADVRGDAAMFAAEDVATLRENAVREARSMEMEAMNQRARARASRSAASSALVGGAFGVAETLLGGAVQYKRLRPLSGRR